MRVAIAKCLEGGFVCVEESSEFACLLICAFSRVSVFDCVGRVGDLRVQGQYVVGVVSVFDCVGRVGDL